MIMENKIRKCLPQEVDRIVPLFADWEETMIWSCLQGVMGDIYVPDGKYPVSAAAQLNDFCFLTGEPCADMVTFDYGRDFLIMVPQNESWAELIEEVLGDKAARRMRYAIKKEPNCFDACKLSALVNMLPKQYEIHRINRTLYEQCLENAWSSDLVSGYPAYEDFERLGIGFVITENGKIVSGASSYSRYNEGIEIEIDTKEEYRRNGLAASAASALILECLNCGLYPSWDAHNKASVALAEKLGYSFSHEYLVYEVKNNLADLLTTP